MSTSTPPSYRGRAALLVSLVVLLIVPTVRAQDPSPTPPRDGPPFSLPFADPPGPNTWLYEQHYGNTTSAFNFGDVWYQHGQGLHFGVDFEAPCGTPVRAIADGVVAYVDGEGFGAGPHTLVLQHPGTGYSSLYGHLRDVPAFVRGDTVQRGEAVGVSGDPDGSCGSRPHLHLEIRSEDYGTAYNPLPFFEANWHMIASIGPVNNAFQQDLDHPFRWMRLEDQPEIVFSGNLLNNYQRPWPFRLEVRAPVNPPVFRHLPALPEDVAVIQEPVALAGWNIGPWWSPTDPDAVYLIDARRDDPAAVYRQPLNGALRRRVEDAPPALRSPDGGVAVTNAGGGVMRITRLVDGAAWEVDTGGNYPAVSPDNTKLLWEVVFGDIVPGTSTPGVRAVVSGLDGSEPHIVTTYSDGYALWLDDHRLLVVRRITYTTETQLSVIDLDQPEPQPVLLGSVTFFRGLKVAPGGQRIAYFVAFQENPRASGVYVQSTQPGSAPRRLDAFGAYQWRDDDTLYMLSFDPAADAHALGVADAASGEVRWLTDPDRQPIRVANGDWSVSPDGTRIVYVDPANDGLYLLTVDGD